MSRKSQTKINVINSTKNINTDVKNGKMDNIISLILPTMSTFLICASIKDGHGFIG